MDLETIKKYCLSKKGTSYYFPFDEYTMVIRVGSKMFVLMNINNSPLGINLKCNPYMAIDLRRDFPCIKPGYHMNKAHWNTVTIDGSLPEDKIFWLIDLSYELVFKGLKKAEKQSILEGLLKADD